MPRETRANPEHVWATRGGLYQGTFDEVLCPTDQESARIALFEAARIAREKSGQIALIGAGRSFAPHFLPADRPGFRMGIDCTQLREIEIFQRSEEDRTSGVLRVSVGAGVKFSELLQAVRSVGHFFPFSLPTAGAITVGGALAANTHSRSSATYGGLFADHVQAVRLLTVGGDEYTLQNARSQGLESELFHYLPGSFGALGLVTRVDLELTLIEPTVVEAEVLVRREGDHLATFEDYLKFVQSNRKEGGYVCEEGYGLVFFGHPLKGASLVMGRRRVEAKVAEGAALPLFSGSRQRAALVQALAHRFPQCGQALASRMLAQGKKFQSEYQRWALFQDSYDDASDLAKEARGVWGALRALKLVDPRMTVVHQAWVTPTESVRAFLEAHFALLGCSRYAPLLPRVEFQDLLPLPAGKWPMSPNFEQELGAHCFALSFALRQDRPELTELARDYCEQLSQDVLLLGSKVQITKQLHVQTESLRGMYRQPLENLIKLRQKVDPHGLLCSATLSKLGL